MKRIARILPSAGATPPRFRIAGMALVLVAALSPGLTACGAKQDKVMVMPNVTGEKLDVAKTEIKTAGFDGKVNVDGGGAFGAIVDSNWVVCNQTPGSGQPLSDPPQLTVGRSCDHGASTSASPSTSGSASAQPSSTQSATDAILTTKNNRDLAALLKLGDECDPSIGRFAKRYAGRTIAFDGSIGNMMHHGTYKTRYDLLLGPGNAGANTAVGPAFKYEDVNVFDLKFAGNQIPDYIGVGDRFHFVAEVDNYNRNTCLFFLKPVSTVMR